MSLVHFEAGQLEMIMSSVPGMFVIVPHPSQAVVLIGVAGTSVIVGMDLAQAATIIRRLQDVIQEIADRANQPHKSIPSTIAQ